jgi:hypothetical protein
MQERLVESVPEVVVREVVVALEALVREVAVPEVWAVP